MSNENSDRKNVDDEAVIKKHELTYLNANKGYCGVSLHFENLSGLKDAYTQATMAISLGRKLNSEARIYDYQDYSIYHMLFCCSKEVNLETLYYKPLNTVMENDVKRSTDNIKLLEIYINNDRNITETANTLHLHRNSVLYRLERIEEMLGASLDDPDLRLQLLISFKTLRLMKVNALNCSYNQIYI